jgi:hypothetical protein
MRLIAASLLALAGATQAAVIAEVSDGRSRIALHDEAGPCLAGALLAVFTRGPERIPGCWKVTPQFISIAFLDGDALQLPLEMFKPPKDS